MEGGKPAEFSELITRFSLTSLLLRLYFFQKNEKKREEDKEADV